MTDAFKAGFATALEQSAVNTSPQIFTKSRGISRDSWLCEWHAGYHFGYVVSW